MIEWLTDNWLKIAIPVLAFLGTYAVGLWLRSVLYNVFERWSARAKWESNPPVTTAAHRAFLFWFLLIGVIIAIYISVLPAEAKNITTRTVGSLFVLSLGWVIVIVIEQLLQKYLPRLKAPLTAIAMVINIVRTAFIIVGVLIILEIWGIPTTPILLLIAVVVTGAALALRNTAPDFFAGFQLGSTQQIKVGDYIKLETGEEGYVTNMGWNNTHIKTLTDTIVVVPNSRLIQNTLINYGRPLKKAREPFHFYSRTHLTELTGLKAKNLHELVDILKKAPDAVIYYHTHRFLEQYHYLTPEPSNDFAFWVSEELGDEAMGERLASIVITDFPSLGALRERLVGVIEEYLSVEPNSREAMAGEEFYFMKAVSVILPTPYIAHDLREFVEALRRISLGSLYFHIFESRMRLGNGLNDFSVLMQGSLDEAELGAEIARLDPYIYTLEGLRSALIQLIEKRIK